jgi:nucleoside permease NupC
VHGRQIFSPVFAFSALSSVIVFSSFIAMLFYLGVIQYVVKRMAIFMQV